MLGFEPEHVHFDIEPRPLPEHQYQLFAALRDENRLLSSEIASYTHGSRKQAERKQRIPEPGDLVLVRNPALDNQKGRKLEARWLGPRLFLKWVKHKHSGFVRELHGNGAPKRYHIDDLIVYHEREPVLSGAVQLATPFYGTTPVHQSSFRFQAGRAGQRALFLLP